MNVKTALSMYFEDTATWRDGMAEAHPTDERHVNSAEALWDASAWIFTLPDDDLRLFALNVLVCKFDGSIVPGERFMRLTKGHGFYVGHWDNDHFLTSLVKAARADDGSEVGGYGVGRIADATTTVRVPDGGEVLTAGDLAADLEKYPQINVSGAAQDCSQAAVEFERARAAGEMTDLIVDAWDEQGEPLEYAIHGRLLGTSEMGEVYEYEGQDGHGFLWSDDHKERVYLMDDARELVDALSESMHRGDTLAAEVANALAMKPRVRL